MPNMSSPDLYPRHVSRWTGVLFFVAFIGYGFGDAWMGSLRAGPDFLAALPARAHEAALASLMLLSNSVAIVLIAALVYSLLACYSTWVAVAYLCTRVAEGLLLLAGTLAQLLLVPLAEAYATAAASDAALYGVIAKLAVKCNHLSFQFAMLLLGLGSLPLCVLLLRSRVAPAWLALWGLGGYALLAAGAVAELFGHGWGVQLSIPGGLFEVVFGVWLMVCKVPLAPAVKMD